MHTGEAGHSQLLTAQQPRRYQRAGRGQVADVDYARPRGAYTQRCLQRRAVKAVDDDIHRPCRRQ